MIFDRGRIEPVTPGTLNDSPPHLTGQCRWCDGSMVVPANCEGAVCPVCDAPARGRR